MKPRYLHGSTECCPKCASSKIAYDPTIKLRGYGPGLAVCLNCETMWEPFDSAQIWDKADPHCSFKEPCNNCAFRPGSPEQADPEKWKTLLDQLKCGGHFYCHKGVPIEAGAEHGFAYPATTVSVEINGEKRRRHGPPSCAPNRARPRRLLPHAGADTQSGAARGDRCSAPGVRGRNRRSRTGPP
jgi:hypothetical protein